MFSPERNDSDYCGYFVTVESMTTNLFHTITIHNSYNLVIKFLLVRKLFYSPNILFCMTFCPTAGTDTRMQYSDWSRTQVEFSCV